MKKKWFLVEMMLVAILVLSACSPKEDSNNGTSDVSYNEDNTEPISKAFSEEENGIVEIIQDNVEPSLSQDEDTIVSVEQAFTAVLLNEMPILYIDKVPYQQTVVNSEYTDILNNLPNRSYGNNEKMIISQFAVVDMDGDTLPEIVLETEDDSGYLNGYCILRYIQGEVWGYAIGSRSLENLREDGTHMGDAGAGDIWIERLLFIDDTFVKDEIAHMEEGYSYGNYTFHGINVDKSVWDDTESSFFETKEAEWHDFTEEAIREWVTENSLLADISIEVAAELSERQRYLDSLSYLIELTLDCSLNEQENPEQYRADAESYYKGCTEEMNRIYELCLQKLSGQDLEDFQAEQQRWHEAQELNLWRDLNDIHYNSIEELEERPPRLYFDYGDRIFRRILRLIDIYTV